MEERICSPWHIQFIGKVTVNFYPSKSTAYVNGMHKGFHCGYKKAKAIADNPELIKNRKVKRAKRIKNRSAMRKHLYFDMRVVNCFVCGEPMAFNETTLEHIIPLCRGGAEREDNYSLSHEVCNKIKGNKITID